MKKVSLLATSIAFALVGCGGSDGGSDTGAPSAGGIVITGFDGYFNHAVVFDDVNNNGILETEIDTVFGLTNAKGQITLDENTDIKGALALQTLTPGDTTKALAVKLAALSPEADTYSDFMNTYTTDMDHEGQPMANAVVFRSPNHQVDALVISPLTDLVAIEMSKNQGMTVEAATEAVNVILGGTEEQPIDLFSDFVAESKTNLGSAQLHKTAQILTESKALSATDYEKNAADIATKAQETSKDIVTDETMGTDELLNTKPVINPSQPNTVITNYKLLVNETAKEKIDVEINKLTLEEHASFNHSVIIPDDLFEDKYNGTLTHVQARAHIDGNEIKAELNGTVLTLSAENLQPTRNEYTLTFTADDKATADSVALSTLSTTFTVKVVLANSAPTLDEHIQATLQEEVTAWKLTQGVPFSQSILVDGLFSDREGDELTYSSDINTVVSGLTSRFDKKTGTLNISGTPQPKHLGDLQFTIVANDGHAVTRLASKPATFALPSIEVGEITINNKAKEQLSDTISNWTLQVGSAFNQTIDISDLFDSKVNGKVEFYANYAEHDHSPAKNPISGVTVSVNDNGVVTLKGTPTKVTNGVILYVAQGINFSGGEENDIESEMVQLVLPNVQPTDEVTPPPTQKHPLENKNWYVLERGSDDGDGNDSNDYSRVWCDTYRFEDGKALSNQRSPSNSHTCSEEVTVQEDSGTYIIDDNNNLVATFTFIEDGETLTETLTIAIQEHANVSMDNISTGAKSVLFSMENPDELGNVEHETKTFFANKADTEKRINVTSSDSAELRDAPLYWPGKQEGEYLLTSTSLEMGQANGSGNSHDYIKVWINGVSCDGLFEGFDGDSPIFERFFVTSNSISTDEENGWYGNVLNHYSCDNVLEDGTPNAAISFLFGLNDNYSLNTGETYSIIGKIAEGKSGWNQLISDINFNMTWDGQSNND